MSEKRTLVSFDWAIKKMPEEERNAYERYMVDRVSERDMITTARIEGRVEGKLEIAANMLGEAKYTVEEIAEATRLCEEQVRELEQRKGVDDSTE
ncbi:MAG: hypothetical protein D3910_23660 [Candidatus Electrothrix sp. ATG2]|nr:hypothetical protein [Candidatus Electrothrix sp. ATG2]